MSTILLRKVLKKDGDFLTKFYNRRIVESIIQTSIYARLTADFPDELWTVKLSCNMRAIARSISSVHACDAERYQSIFFIINVNMPTGCFRRFHKPYGNRHIISSMAHHWIGAAAFVAIFCPPMHPVRNLYMSVGVLRIKMDIKLRKR